MSDALTSWVRTVVPTLWSALIAWLITLGLPESFGDALGGLSDTVIVPAVLAVVFAGIRWLEPRLPDGLSILLTGSPRTPHYSPAGPVGRHARGEQP